jgi:hypothetical protein
MEEICRITHIHYFDKVRDNELQQVRFIDQNGSLVRVGDEELVSLRVSELVDSMSFVFGNQRNNDGIIPIGKVQSEDSQEVQASYSCVFHPSNKKTDDKLTITDLLTISPEVKFVPWRGPSTITNKDNHVKLWESDDSTSIRASHSIIMEMSSKFPENHKPITAFDELDLLEEEVQLLRQTSSTIKITLSALLLVGLLASLGIYCYWHQ